MSDNNFDNPINNNRIVFNPEAFANELLEEAKQVIPSDIKKGNEKFILEIIYRFCLLCGDALIKDKEYNFDTKQIKLITQFVAEWTFHKTIDLIRGGVSPDLREDTLQKVAFTVFVIAKQKIAKNLPLEDFADIIEKHVEKIFKNALKDLKEKDKIDTLTYKRTMEQSNIDDMYQSQLEEGEDEEEILNFEENVFSDTYKIDTLSIWIKTAHFTIAFLAVSVLFNLMFILNYLLFIFFPNIHNKFFLSGFNITDIKYIIILVVFSLVSIICIYKLKKIVDIF